MMADGKMYLQKIVVALMQKQLKQQTERHKKKEKQGSLTYTSLSFLLYFEEIMENNKYIEGDAIKANIKY